MLKMQKKGAELSLNVIIIAAIALIVLVILAVLVIRAGGNVNDQTKDTCLTKGGLCKQVGECESEKVIEDTKGCSDATPVCCRQI